MLKMRGRIVGLLLLLAPAVIGAQSAALEQVFERVRSSIRTADYSVASVREFAAQQSVDGTWPDINYEDVSRTGFQHQKHLERIFSMSLAIADPESASQNDPDLIQAVQAALQHWAEQDYRCENWWFNQVFTPRTLVNSLILIGDQLPEELVAALVPIIGVANLEASGARQGADRMKIGNTLARASLLQGDEALFAETMQVLNEEVRFATGVRGIQADYSFHHRIDRVNNTISYGNGYAASFAEWAAFVAGTDYAFREEKINILIDYYLDGVVKQLVYGRSPDVGTLNRSVSRPNTYSFDTAIAKHLLLACAGYRAEELEELIAVHEENQSPQYNFCRFYWQTEHFVCQRPNWFASVRMHSLRNENMESPYNEEGLFNHHRGDGVNHHYRFGNEYHHIWPVYDWQKIPGATILQKPELGSPQEIRKPGISQFVGAVTDGDYGAVAYDFISAHDGTKARKSWFFFDDAYVCLGAGIESPSYELPVVTTLQQSLLNGNVWVSNAQGSSSLAAADSVLDSIGWVYHNGTGYRWDRPQRMRLEAGNRWGSWADINRQWHIPQDTVQKKVFQLWIDHGPRPQGRPGGLNHADNHPKDATYQYTVFPNTQLGRMEAATGPQVLINNRWLQAVEDPATGIVQAIFYRAGSLELADGRLLSLDSPGAIMLKPQEDGRLAVSLADPSRVLGRIHFSLSGDFHAHGSEVGYQYEAEFEHTSFRVDLPQGDYAGDSRGIVLRER
ncbi:MAG: polysaccharide lyase family 8 super-sandwich domain-containing protein [Bacteroidota bacterium]